MSRWQRIKELAKKDKSIHDNIELIYKQHGFPVGIREHFADWFEFQQWWDTNFKLALRSQYACGHISFLTVKIVGNMN